MECSGTVLGGSRKAGSLGFPTANIALSIDAAGIYLASVSADGKEYPAVAYADPGRGVLESYLFGFVGDLYGKGIRVTLIEKMRDARPFAGDEDAKKAIAQDIEEARAYFHI